MRCHPARWLWGLIPVAMLSWLAVQVERSAIESDLEQRSAAALAAAGQGWASVAFDGRDGLLVGHPDDEHQRGQAVALVGEVWGVRVVRTRADARAPATRSIDDLPIEPAIPRAEPDRTIGDDLPEAVVSDAVPDATPHDSIASATLDAAAPAEHLHAGEAQIAAPAGASPALAAAPPPAAATVPPALSAETPAPEAPAAATHEDEIATAADPEKIVIPAADAPSSSPPAATPPAEQPATPAPAREAATVTEPMPELPVHKPTPPHPERTAANTDLPSAVAPMLPSAEATAPGTPLGPPAPGTPDKLPTFAPPSASAGTTLAIRVEPPVRKPPPEAPKAERGPAPTAPVASAQRPATAPPSPAPRFETAALPPGNIVPSEPCLDEARGAARRVEVHFARGDTRLVGPGKALIDGLISALNACPDAVLHIAGHADASGKRRHNQLLSRSRARGVASYMSHKGIDAGRLVAVGYGDKRPVAPNDNQANRARNRRIELTVTARAAPVPPMPIRKQGTRNGLSHR